MPQPFKVKIYGAGSIGNHLAHASRVLGWSVDIVDVSADALDRTRDKIYPSRYGKWDVEIGLFKLKEEPTHCYDLIIVGTPPDSHLELALKALDENPQAILIEKPLCTPDLKNALFFREKALRKGIRIFVGYDHVVGLASEKFCEKMNSFGQVQALDVEFREHWGGIFAAHPWLDGPSDTYLGYWKRGGGALGEHSHGINLWQHFAHLAGAGRVTAVSASVNYVTGQNLDYDSVAFLNLKTETGLVGRVVQDVVTSPARKWARLQCESGYVEWCCGEQPGLDSVRFANTDKAEERCDFKKTRPDDFIRELEHIRATLEDVTLDAPLSLDHGLETMMIIAAAHKSSKEGRVVSIDYSQGYTLSSLY